MKNINRLLPGILLLVFSLPAFAGSCPLHMKKIDAALEDNTSLSAADMARVKELRAEGESLHKSGSHGDSVAKLREARKLLGI